MIPVRSLAVVASLLCTAWAPIPQAPTARVDSGLTYDFTTQTLSIGPNGDTVRTITMQGHAALQGDKARIDIDDAGQLGNRLKGAYFLSLSGGKQMVWVVPSKKQYYTFNEMGMKALATTPEINGTNSPINIAASNVHIDVKNLGPGPTLEGHPTVHYRMTQSMDLTTKVLSYSRTSHHEITIDYACAPDLEKFVNPFLNGGESPMGGMQILGDEYATKVNAAKQKMANSGAPLRMVTTTTTGTTPGNTTKAVSIMNVTNLKQTTVSDSLFVIPADYTQFKRPRVTDTTVAHPRVTPADSTHNQ
jgi:hypothetical protein